MPATISEISTNPVVKDYADVNGIKMYYEIHGREDGIPLVLIHGGGSTIESNWSTLLPVLSKKYKVVALELQAHGRTSDRNSPESFEQDAADVVSLLQFLGIAKANLIGFSNGGTTSLQIAIKHPGAVNKIVTISCNYKKEGMLPGFFEGMEKAGFEDMPQPLKQAYLDVNPDEKGLLNMFQKDRERMINFKDLPDQELQSINAPALIISGDQDVVTVDHIVRMSKLIPNASLAILPGTHGSFIGEICSKDKESRMPSITAALIEEFLNQ